ncbi:putative cyclase [Cucurbitaria berberidis CBS 394.84]|uniref:Cyclase n=1 Tax=Cucurbitaria berberidis CBS 394.84 TaxID=1168544 RepID=A0A9P4GH71_9PLEO|nr:putative cyclase [Cucurbitaria berberidis CBS 394.84]KAF1846058.1 putative cyclase [Cucurbitaria berberidis CBS 394.84]
MAVNKPSFDELPLAKDGPHGNAWGLFGSSDELGMLNLLTPATTAAAASEIKDGVRVALDWPLDLMAEPCFGRVPFKQEIKNKAPRSVNDDTLTFNTQCSTQWDGLRHYGYQKEAKWFNGKTLDDLLNTKALGTHAWVENGGIVSRGLLLDYASWAEKEGLPVDCFSTSSIPVAVLKQVAASQNTIPRPGDILLIRTGWTKQYEYMTQDQRRALADMTSPPAIGVESSKETLRWLWESGFAAVAGDMPSFEAWPCQNTDFWLHEWLLAGWGMPIGELFDLERLSQECKKRDRWTFFFSSMPLYVPGGVASPPNAVAIF